MRVEKLRALMRSRGIGAALITRPENMRYLSGYTGEGALLVDDLSVVIITDFRYVEQAARQAPDCLCVRTTAEEKLAEKLKGLMDEREHKALAFEPEVMSVCDHRKLEKILPGVELTDLGGIVQELRKVKDEGEIDCIARAARISCEAFDKLLGMIRPGMTEREVQVELDFLMLRGGAEANAFSTIAAAGLNGSLPHATPGEHRLAKGELLTLDFGAQVEGYKSDMTRTVAIGKPSDELRAIYDLVLEAQLRSLEAVRPGVVCRDVDAIARTMIDAKYPGAFGHSLGHGVGLEIHEAPSFSVKCDLVLEAGHVMTVEPGIYVPGLGGCRIEDTVILRSDGYDNPYTSIKELIVL